MLQPKETESRPVYCMEQPPYTRSSLRLTLIIVSLLGLSLTSIFLSRRTIHQIQEASASIYQDRLVPTAIIASLTSKIYQKRLLLETHVLGKTGSGASLIGPALNRLNRQVDSLVTEFAQTKLTLEEAGQLTLLKERLAVYNQLEGEITTKSGDQPQAPQMLFAGSGHTAFGQVAQTLTELSTLQLTVGEQLLNQSRGQTNYIYVLTTIQIGLVIIVAFSMFWHKF
jgi:hypothetical protein